MARIFMFASWAAAASLAGIAVVSTDIKWRVAAVILAGLVVLPSLLIAFRSIAAREPSQETQSIRQTEASSNEQQTGVYMDPLTGLATRHYLTMFLNREISRCKRSGAELSLAIFDFPDLSKVEEQSALTAMADVGAKMKSMLRDYDLVALFSLGRLAIVLPETNVSKSLEIVERLHQLATGVCADDKPLTATAGLASFPTHGDTSEWLITSAHRALNQCRAGSSKDVHVLENYQLAG